MLNIVRAFCCAAAREFIHLAFSRLVKCCSCLLLCRCKGVYSFGFFSPDKLQAAFRPPQLHLLISCCFELPANGRVTCPRQSIKEFQVLGSLIS